MLGFRKYGNLEKSRRSQMRGQIRGKARFTAHRAILGAVILMAFGSSSAPKADPTSSAMPSTLRDDSHELMVLALKFVEYRDPKSGRPVMNQIDAQKVVDGVNKIWGQCGLQVKMERYQTVAPSALSHQKLNYHLSSMDELDRIRSAFDDKKDLVVINTGGWDHKKMGSANAWTAMPGDAPAGAVIEGPVARNSQIIAHELGHYLGLDHVSDPTDMMNPLIYDNSTTIYSAQCDSMRKVAQSAHPQALRPSA
jgi:hypothetical protein